MLGAEERGEVVGRGPDAVQQTRGLGVVGSYQATEQLLQLL